MLVAIFYLEHVMANQQEFFGVDLNFSPGKVIAVQFSSACYCLINRVFHIELVCIDALKGLVYLGTIVMMVFHVYNHMTYSHIYCHN